MAKGRLIDTVKDRASGITVEIRLNRETEQFTAEVEGKALTAPDLPGLRHLINEALAETVTIAWMAAIRVWLQDDGFGQHHFSSHQGKLFLAVERTWIAQRRSGEIISARWETANEQGEDQRRARSHVLDRFSPPKDQPLALPICTGQYSRQLLLPYDEALFGRLQWLAKAFDQIDGMLYHLLLSTAGRAFLSDGSPIDPDWFDAAQKVQAITDADASEGAGD